MTAMSQAQHPPWGPVTCRATCLSSERKHFSPSLVSFVAKRRSPTHGSIQRAKTTWPDFAIRLIDVIYELLQARNIIGFTLFVSTLIFFIVAARSPQGSISAASSGFQAVGTFLANEKFYIFPLGASLAFSLATNWIQHKVYREHINDLTEHRKLLVHGLQSGKLKPLKDHNSSGYED